MKTILSVFLFVSVSFSVQSQSLCKYYLDLSQHYTHEKDFDQAFYYANKAIKMYPDTARCYLMRGGAYFFSKNLEEAWADLNTFINMNPADPEGYFWRGSILFGLELFTDAEQDFLFYLKKDPSSIEARYKLAETYFEQRKSNEAKIEFSEVLKGDSSIVTCYNFLGLIAEQENDYELSIEYFTKGIALDKTSPSFYYNRGRVNTYAGNKDAACKDLKMALKLGIDDANMWLGANNCADLKGLSEADEIIDKQERFTGKKRETSTINVTSNYLPMLRHSRYTYKSETDGKIDTAAIAVLYDDHTTDDYYFDLWNVRGSDIDQLYFELLHTSNFRSTKDSLKLLVQSRNSELIPIPLFPREFTIGKEVIIENSWNEKASYEMKNAAISLEGIEKYEMPNGETKDCIKLRIELRINNGRDELSYLWLVKDFGIVKSRNSSGKVWEIIRYAVHEYGSFPEEEYKHLLPPPEEIMVEDK
ncbi:MAG: tetratricopeptide repeat protein [Crocinitomicaceae bacterium]|nr:tetratricopeptide repeat protein [Flavobacteriales bacterium]NQZ34909.1 tetratricopeptide repeat protein [Crocinitomicaceae bacterium]